MRNSATEYTDYSINNLYMQENGTDHTLLDVGSFFMTKAGKTADIDIDSSPTLNLNDGTGNLFAIDGVGSYTQARIATGSDFTYWYSSLNDQGISFVQSTQSGGFSVNSTESYINATNVGRQFRLDTGELYISQDTTEIISLTNNGVQLGLL